MSDLPTLHDGSAAAAGAAGAGTDVTAYELAEVAVILSEGVAMGSLPRRIAQLFSDQKAPNVATLQEYVQALDHRIVQQIATGLGNCADSEVVEAFRLASTAIEKWGDADGDHLGWELRTLLREGFDKLRGRADPVKLELGSPSKPLTPFLYRVNRCFLDGYPQLEMRNMAQFAGEDSRAYREYFGQVWDQEKAPGFERIAEAACFAQECQFDPRSVIHHQRVTFGDLAFEAAIEPRWVGIAHQEREKYSEEKWDALFVEPEVVKDLLGLIAKGSTIASTAQSAVRRVFRVRARTRLPLSFLTADMQLQKDNPSRLEARGLPPRSYSAHAVLAGDRLAKADLPDEEFIQLQRAFLYELGCKRRGGLCSLYENEQFLDQALINAIQSVPGVDRTSLSSDLVARLDGEGDSVTTEDAPEQALSGGKLAKLELSGAELSQLQRSYFYELVRRKRSELQQLWDDRAWWHEALDDALKQIHFPDFSRGGPPVADGRPTLESLPDEILSRIVGFLRPVSIRSLIHTSRRLNARLGSGGSPLWSDLVLRRYPEYQGLNPQRAREWYELLMGRLDGELVSNSLQIWGEGIRGHLHGGAAARSQLQGALIKVEEEGKTEELVDYLNSQYLGRGDESGAAWINIASGASGASAEVREEWWRQVGYLFVRKCWERLRNASAEEFETVIEPFEEEVEAVVLRMKLVGLGEVAALPSDLDFDTFVAALEQYGSLHRASMIAGEKERRGDHYDAADFSAKLSLLGDAADRLSASAKVARGSRFDDQRAAGLGKAEAAPVSSSVSPAKLEVDSDDGDEEQPVAAAGGGDPVALESDDEHEERPIAAAGGGDPVAPARRKKRRKAPPTSRLSRKERRRERLKQNHLRLESEMQATRRRVSKHPAVYSCYLTTRVRIAGFLRLLRAAVEEVKSSHKRIALFGITVLVELKDWSAPELAAWLSVKPQSASALGRSDAKAEQFVISCAHEIAKFWSETYAAQLRCMDGSDGLRSKAIERRADSLRERLREDPSSRSPSTLDSEKFGELALLLFVNRIFKHGVAEAGPLELFMSIVQNLKPGVFDSHQRLARLRGGLSPLMAAKEEARRCKVKVSQDEFRLLDLIVQEDSSAAAAGAAAAGAPQ